MIAIVIDEGEEHGPIRCHFTGNDTNMTEMLLDNQLLVNNQSAEVEKNPTSWSRIMTPRLKKPIPPYTL